MQDKNRDKNLYKTMVYIDIKNTLDIHKIKVTP